ncbi:hypothetical protein AB0910_17710 [Streptomyces sp. NPDC047002]|uniref:hypothetical protein n=1 Tax=Streptomyces sp. NPDC047002 TaxID=3155475 RepID=UPI003456A0C4
MNADQQEALAAAQQQAAAKGRPVLVDALTTPTATVTAETSGALTWTSHVLPVRVRQNGTWVPVDATLTRNDDGSYSPAAAAEPLILSGGGDGPLATLRTGSAQLSLTWPQSLPAPVVSGSEITYPDVLRDVDLRLTANTLGGFSEVLVVKNAEAAADPALTTLRLGVHGTGVKLGDDGHDNLAATAPDGRVLFSAPQPLMWDSGTAGAPAARSAAAAAADTPPAGAQVGRVTTHASDSAVTLAPDQGLLSDPGTHYPVYIDPTWNPHYASGAKQHFAEVQKGCPTAKNYDSTAHGDPGAGNNTFSGCVGVERSYFQLAFPSSIWGTHIVSAQVDVKENYSASCSASSSVALYWSGAISSGTTWNNRPSLTSKLGTTSFGPACSSEPSGSYTATSTIAKGASAHWKSWTFALVNSDESSGTHFKRFATNPSVSVTYNHAPAKPTTVTAKIGSSSLGCATSTPYPVIGKTLASTPPTLNAVLNDTDKDALAATYTYWAGSGAKTTTTSATVASGKNAPKQLPASFVSGLADGTVVNWTLSSSDGKDTTAYGSTCHFTVDLHAPAQPTIASADGLYPQDSPGTTRSGTPGSFTVAVDPGTSGGATTFVWGLDAVPPTSNPPANRTVAANNNTATITVTPPAPGTHSLYVYALDAAGNASPVSPAYEFEALGHAAQRYGSFSAALNNTAVTSDTSAGAGDADGTGRTLSLQDLKAAGWQPGGQVTVDGARFTLPGFGTGAADNVLAANQTIEMNGAAGNALVFLATATNGTVASAHDPEDLTSPLVPDGTPVPGTYCRLSNGTSTDCEAATGSIAYTGSDTSVAYRLAVPDWTGGPAALASVTLPHLNSTAGQKTGNAKIYAFSVPLRSGVTLESVTLPDVSDTAAKGVPGLHIFGMAVRAQTPPPGGGAWTGAWSSPNEGRFNFQGADFKDQTFRIATTPSVSGSTVRIRLSNALGTTPLTIDHTTVATRSSGAVPVAKPVDMTFDGGGRSTTIPAGGEVYSDPLSFTATAGKDLMVSLHLVNDAPYLVQHSWSDSSFEYVAAAGTGDHTADTSTTAFTGSGARWGYFTDILTDVDVATQDAKPTVAIIGDGLVDPFAAANTAAIATPRLSDDLTAALQAGSQGQPPFGVVATGIENNLLTTDQDGRGGPAMLSRLDRDVFGLSGVRTAVIVQGLTDLMAGSDDDRLVNTYQVLGDQLRARGIKVVFTTLTPCAGYKPCTADADADRLSANTWITDQTDFSTPYLTHADLESVVGVPDPASTLDPPALILDKAPSPHDYDSGDHVNYTADAFQALAAALGATTLAPDGPPDA